MKSPKRHNRQPANAPPDARRRVLAAWRGVDLDPLKEAQRVPARSAKDLLPAVLEDLRLDRRQAETEIVRVWNQALDPNLTAHAQPVGLHQGTLFVNVDNSVWLDEIVRYRRREILHRLQNSFGKDLVTRISFRIG